MELEEAKITEELAEFAGAVRYKDLPPKVQEVAKRCIIDGIGVILAGSTEPCAKILADYARSLNGREESTFLGKGKNKGPANLAALVNGTAGHALDWDDTAISDTPERGVLLHPTLPPLAAGLALGEKLAASGQDLLTAFVVGFEIECKIAAAIDVDHRLRGFHSSGTCGIFGASVAAARLMGLSAEQIRNALGIAASMSSGLGVQSGTMSKPLHVGRAAENGVVCVQMASLGFEAQPNALEGHKGFFQTMGGGFNSNEITGKLGQPFSILKPGVSVKPYPSGVVGHPTMDAMQLLVIRHEVRPQEVKRVKIATGSNIPYPKGPLRYKKAQTALQAKFCIPFQMASMIIRRKAGMMEFTDEFVQSHVVQTMMDRVETFVDPELDLLGENKYVSLIEVELKNGRILYGRSSESLRGGPSCPLSREEMVNKFNDCVQRVLEPKSASLLLESIESLECLTNVRTLVELATAP